MKKQNWNYYYAIFIMLLLGLSACGDNEKDKQVDKNVIPESVVDYQNILKKGKLVVLAENSSTSYFIYRGEKLGYEYEVLKEFASEIGVELEIKMVANLDNLIPMLERGEGDIIACNYTVTRERQKQISFSVPFIQSPQVLIQKKPEGWQKMTEEQLNAKLIKEPIDMARKKINVWENSSYYQRLMHLQDEIGDTIFIEPVNGLIGSEELIEQVSQGIIDYTVVEENVARVNERFFDNIDIGTTISVKQNIAFGLRKKSSLLKAKLDTYLGNFLGSRVQKYMYRKYFEVGMTAQKSQIDNSTMKGGKISRFDDLFIKAGKKYNIDWQLLAAIAYQESKFNPFIESFGGAYGMMQFMPNTGPHYGVYPDSEPEVQIMGGMKKLAADLDYWKNVPDPEQKIKFALASYNAGRGHVLDAKRLAEKHGMNALSWDDNVEKMILNLSKQEYYRDEVVKSGAMRGTTTYNYVEHVYTRYLEYKAFTK